MHALLEFVKSLHSAEGIKNIVQSGGLFALLGIIFAETGLLAGFFLPGDSLLVTAGIFAATDGKGGPGIFNLYLLLALVTLAAVIGDQLGFYLGKTSGPLIFKREDSFFFKKKHLVSAHEFYIKHGPPALILARFVPIFRTFVPFTAGIAQMPYSRFLRFSILGGVLWVFSMLLIGYFLGLSPYANELHKIILVVVFVSILPILFSVGKKIFVRASEPTPPPNS